jgi:hypothetical protein
VCIGICYWVLMVLLLSGKLLRPPAGSYPA